MTENEWTRSICERLQGFLQDKALCADTLVKIPYSQEITGYTEDWEPEERKLLSYETDMTVYEKADGIIIPRVIIEAKIGNVTTHDAITYSHKAEQHKEITPYLRYGIMLGKRRHYPLPGRLYRHGTNFDFMFSFRGEEPSSEEWDSFTEMILNEVMYSRTLEEMLHESLHRDRKRYYMLEKQLVLREFEED